MPCFPDFCLQSHCPDWGDWSGYSEGWSSRRCSADARRKITVVSSYANITIQHSHAANCDMTVFSAHHADLRQTFWMLLLCSAVSLFGGKPQCVVVQEICALFRIRGAQLRCPAATRCTHQFVSGWWPNMCIFEHGKKESFRGPKLQKELVCVAVAKCLGKVSITLMPVNKYTTTHGEIDQQSWAMIGQGWMTAPRR